jgi:hypothetical protein
MRKTILSRVDVLENEERSRKLDQQSSVATISFFYRKIVLAYYVGGLKPDDEDPGEAEARALNYDSRNDYLEALLKGKNKKSIDDLRMLLAPFSHERASTSTAACGVLYLTRLFGWSTSFQRHGRAGYSPT